MSLIGKIHNWAKISLSPQLTTKSINKRCKQKVLTSNMNTREISIYIYEL